jgi:repressor LexA
MAREPLTLRQQQLLDYFQQMTTRAGKPPSLRRAARDLGVSHAAVAQGLKSLEKKGRVKRQGRYSRAVELIRHARGDLTSDLQRWREVPVIGRVRAGLPMYAQQEWDDSIVVDAGIFPGANLFCLRIQGDSMQAAGINEGDWAVCEPRQYARSGEIVVALIGGEEATVKRFFLHADHIELRSENSLYAPLRYGFGEILIQGRVIGIVRGPEGMEK